MFGMTSIRSDKQFLPQRNSIRESEMEQRLIHKWIPVENDTGIPYYFPEQRSLLFYDQWSVPAIYRWGVFNKQSNTFKQIYIGEAINLYERIKGYINPGPSQGTNQRLNSLFHEEIAQGNRVVLEALTFEPFQIDGVIIAEENLCEIAVRRYLENRFIIYFAKNGYTILNAHI